MKFYMFCMQTSVVDFSVSYGTISNNELKKYLVNKGLISVVTDNE